MFYISLLLALLAVACLIFVPNTVILLSFVAIMHGFAVYSACHALLHKRDSRAALGWIAIILFMPPVGLPLYWLFGIARIDSQAVRLMEKAAQKVMGGLVDLHGKSLTEKPEGFIDKDEVPHAWHYLVNPGSSITGRCMLEGNDLTVLHNGEAAYPVMLKAISEAKERVFLSSFIFGYDEVGKSFAAALRAAAERGCDVRLLMDGVGSFHLWPSWRKRLGPDVKLAYFLPPRLIPPQFSINLRTHRKVLICDSETGFTGGMNISQNHLANLKRRSRVQDVHFRCFGPIAQQLEIAFLMDWSFATGDHANFTVHPVKKQGSSLCRILMDGPGTPEDTILDLRLRPDFGGAAFRADHEPVLPAAAPSARRTGERGPARRGRKRHPARREQPPPCGLGHAPPDAHAGGQGREDLPPAPALRPHQTPAHRRRIHPARLRQPRPPQPQPQLRAGHGSAGSPAGGTAQRLL